jgi:GT2 family glycosyltransferase
MPQYLPRRRTRSRSGGPDDYRELIHELNRRYRREWDRAERLRDELADIRASRAWRLLAWLRRCKRRLLAPHPSPPQGVAFAWGALPERPGQPRGRVSIVIPFKDRVELLRGCLRSFRSCTYRLFDIILVDNGSTEPRTQRYLDHVAGRGRVRLVRCPGPFNFSRLCNEGARKASGDHLLFLNNDTEVLSPDWLEQLLVIERHPEVGVAGATLLYPDRTIQHAGMFPRGDGTWTHAYRGRPEDFEGLHGELRHVRVVPAVTGACLLIRRLLFQEVGGFDERLPVTFGDLDLCARVRAKGFLIVVTPHARLLHFESLSRGYSPECARAAHGARRPAP